MSSNSAHAWNTKACMASADEPDPDTDESWRLYGSSNALFRTQTPDVHFGRVGADNSPDHFSAYLPNILTESHRPTENSEVSQGTNQSLGSEGILLDTDHNSSSLSIACCSFTFSPLALGFPVCNASEEVLSHIITTQSYPTADWDRQEWNFELRPGLVQTLDLDAFSSDLCSQFDFNSTQLTNTLIHIDHFSNSPWPSNVDFEETLSEELRCNWPQCSSLGLFENIEKHKSHLKQHARDVSSSWSPGLKCTWYKCNSKASHRSRNLFEAHLNNIHLNPLMCTVKYCKHKTPFRANHDLQRHIATAHNVDSKYKCPYISCAGRGFIRKDKWMSHLKGHHDTEPCPFEHCQRRTDNIPLHQRSVSRHIGKAHSNFECALTSCKGKISRFKENQLLEHLQFHHAMEWSLVLKARDMMKADGDRTLTSDYIKQDVNVRDCKICMEGL